MKTIFTLSFVAMAWNVSYAQSVQLLDANNARVFLSDDGRFFNDAANSGPGYEIPSGGGNHVAYLMTFLTSGIEADSTIHVAGNNFSSDYDFFPGPVSDHYSSAYYTANFYSSIWKITRSQINYHVDHYNSTGYVPDPAIADWPGNGNFSEGVAAQLAPYVDVNNDQYYNPMDGDFPYIQGDQAVYVILNDEAGYHASTGGTAFGIEIHAMFYQFASPDPAVNNTTFLNAHVYNRRDTNYTNFMFGLFLDGDLGNPTDDYVGSDSARSMGYVYNAVSVDPGGNGQPGYGAEPPAFGAKLLNVPAGAVMTYSSSGFPLPPTSPLDLHVDAGR